jgi:hypothetical protein
MFDLVFKMRMRMTSAASDEISVKIQVTPKPIENAAESFQTRYSFKTSPINGTPT